MDSMVKPRVYAPNDIFKKQAEYIDIVDNIRTIVDKMLQTLHIERAVGLGANMVGILKPVVDLHENNKSSPIVFIVPNLGENPRTCSASF
ncbi:UNVERIFIED_CONTAM: Peptide deformylase-like [Trichonephila clavipes]